MSDQTVEPGGTNKSMDGSMLEWITKNLAIFEATSTMRIRAVRTYWVLGTYSGMVPYLLTKAQVTQAVTSHHRSHPTPV